MPWLSFSAYTELLAKAASVDALKAETERLCLDLKAQREENKDLLNRLLESRQIRPLSEPMPAPRVQAPVFPVISPFQALDAETETLAREAWVNDLAEGLAVEKGVDLDTARRMALSEYTQRYQPIN